MANLFTTNGRIPRSTFWKFYGVLYGVLLIIGMLSDGKKVPEWAQGVMGLILLPFMVMGLIVQIKRWHDLNKSGWWVLINLIPCIGALWSLVECGFIKGTTGDNRFGPDPIPGQ